MSRVPYAKREDFPADRLAAFDRMLAERGNPAPAVFLALANMPNLLDILLSFTREMRSGSVVDPRLRELAILTVGIATGSDYEFTHHWNFAIKAGVRREQLEQIEAFETSYEFDERERAVMRYAQLATLQLRVDDTSWADLQRHLNLRETMDIVMTVAWYNAVVRILIPLEIELEDGFKRL